MNHPFNVRIYGLLVVENKVLILKEPFMGELIHKFPGGGLEFGEGTVECLKREFKEELNLEIEIENHLYTQDFFLQSAMHPKEQILMIYYEVTTHNPKKLHILDEGIEQIQWIELENLSPNDLTLPTDQFVIQLFLQNRAGKNS